MIIGAVFSYLLRTFGRFTFTVGCACGAIGLLMLSTAANMPVVIIGGMLCGVFNTMMMCSMMAEIGMSVPTEMVSRASGTAMGLYCLAPIVATAYTTLVGQIPGVDPMLFIFTVGSVGILAIGTVWTLTHLKKPATPNANSDMGR